LEENIKICIVREFDVPIPEGAFDFDLSRRELRHCVGCWSCWLATPGRCVHKDLDEFYAAFLAADTAYLYCAASQGFLTSNMKALFDRMIPLVLPYIYWPKGESLHLPRYSKYPAVKVFYRGEFLPGEEDALAAYLERTLGMLFANGIEIGRIRAEEGSVS